MATSFKVKFSKTTNQQTITIVRDDNVDLSSMSSVIAKVYTSDLSATVNTYTFSSSEVTSLIAGTVDVTTANLLGSATPDDEFYTIILEGNTAAYVSENAGVAITMTAIYQALSKQGFIDVYSPDFRVDQVLLTSFMLVYEMDNLELQDSSLQKRADFTTREDTLKKILTYE
jgi:hypothetical protein